MAARPPILSVPKNLYKHFAVVTVATTLCIAIFADGAQREQIAEEIASHQAAKAQERQQKADNQDGRMVAGLRDNRGGANNYVINNNPDVGSIATGPLQPTVFPIDEMGDFGEHDLAPKPPRQLNAAERRKLPPVLPPGMSSLPGMPGSADTL